MMRQLEESLGSEWKNTVLNESNGTKSGWWVANEIDNFERRPKS